MSNDWIDAEGFRAYVGIILVNAEDKLMLGGRVGAKGWQFPQGGVLVDEEPEKAMFRELREEVGLEFDDAVQVDERLLELGHPLAHLRAHPLTGGFRDAGGL